MESSIIAALGTAAGFVLAFAGFMMSRSKEGSERDAKIARLEQIAHEHARRIMAVELDIKEQTRRGKE